MKNPLFTAGGAILAIQGIDLANINEAVTLVSTILVSLIALIRLLKNLKTMIPERYTYLSKR